MYVNESTADECVRKRITLNSNVALKKIQTKVFVFAIIKQCFKVYLYGSGYRKTSGGRN